MDKHEMPGAAPVGAKALQEARSWQRGLNVLDLLRAAVRRWRWRRRVARLLQDVMIHGSIDELEELEELGREVVIERSKDQWKSI